jgi:hypothetical protein
VEDESYRSRERNFHEFLADGDQVFGPEWLDIATSDTINLRLTPDQLHSLIADIDVVLMTYIEAYKATPTPGSRPVQIQIDAFPLVRGEPSGDDAKERT